AVVRPGDAMPGVGRLADVTAHAANGSTVEFLGVLPDGRDVLGRAHDGALETLAVDETVVGDRTLDLGPSIVGVPDSYLPVDALLYDADRSTAGQLGIAIVTNAGLVTPVLLPRNERYQGLGAADAALVGNRVVALVRGPKPFVAGVARTKPLPVSGALEI